MTRGRTCGGFPGDAGADCRREPHAIVVAIVVAVVAIVVAVVVAVAVVVVVVAAIVVARATGPA